MDIRPNQVKVASITGISDKADFMAWLDTIPYHIPYTRRESLWEKTYDCRSVLWLKKSKLEAWKKYDGETVYYPSVDFLFFH